MTTWAEVLGRLTSGADLSDDQATWAMESILDGQATSAQMAAFMASLRTKGETGAEVDALVGVMLGHARLLDLGSPPPVVLDVVGTGGDHSHTVNISTMSALVCAAAGAAVVKHGNRAASSSTGTADVLEELGVVIDLEPDDVAASLRRVGMAFCFAPVHHPAMRHVAPVRRELGVPTVFNILGPLTNPGRAQAALIGCAATGPAELMADVLRRRGVRALVVRGEDGLDEISTTALTRVWDVTDGTLRDQLLDVRELGIARVSPDLLRGGDRVRNATLLRAALAAAGDPATMSDDDAPRIAAIRDAVLVNSAAALVAYDAAVAMAAREPVDPQPLAERIEGTLGRARQALDSGAAGALLDRWRAATQAIRAGTPGSAVG